LAAHFSEKIIKECQRPHEDFWRTSILILESFYFYSSEKKKLCKVPSVVNLIKTIKGFINLSKSLLQKVTYNLPRVINQDCLENFFASLREHGRYDKSPDVSHFITSFKALIVNNFMSSHSPGANCEDDSTVGVLDNLKSFLTGQEIAGVSSLEITEPELPKLTIH
jgi:hypothetical protein